MELRHLRYFVSVAENKGFGKAARSLNVSQSSISEQIGDLEAEITVKLFDRKNRQIALTAAGEQFLRDARVVLTHADQAVVNAKRSVKGEIGTLTIGFFVGGTGTFFPAIIKEFRHEFSGVQIALIEMPTGAQHQALVAGTIDLGFTRTVQPVQAGVLRSVPFLTEPLYAVLPKNHALAKNGSVSIRELSEELFILNDRKYSPAVFDKVIMLCAEAGFSPRIGSAATVAPAVLALVEAGEGVAILPHGSKALSHGELVFVPLSDRDASVDLVLAWSSQSQNPVVQSFVQLVKETLKSSTETQSGVQDAAGI